MQPQWRKSSFSYANGNCVQAAVRQAPRGTQLLVRDSKNPTGPVLVFSQHDWDAFVHSLKTRTGVIT